MGAIRAFESVSGMTMDGIAGNTVWSHLFTAVATDKTNPDGYTYALASQHYPETLTVWHNGRVVLKTRPTPASRPPPRWTARSPST